MSRRGVAAIALFAGRAARRAALPLLPFLLMACDGEETKPPPTTGTTTGTSQGGGGSGGTSGGAGGESGSATTGGSTTTGGSAGSGGTGGSSPCGDGFIDVGEACDGDAIGDATCEMLGFPGGMIACTPSCTLDISNCTGADDCTDGIDNDADGATDCQEAECQAACANACATPAILGDPDDTPGFSAGHADVLKSSCSAESGSDVVYTVTATQTGMLDVTLIEDGTADFTVSVRTDCASDASEIACVANYTSGLDLSKKLSIPITAGDIVHILVEADGASAEGTYTLAVQSRILQCGDGIQDSPETCDDQNLDAGDGCSPTCQIESMEPEPNDMLGTAVPIASPYYASIDPAGDVDLIKITLPSTQGIIARVAGLGDQSCFDGSIDSFLTILDALGTPLTSNDDEGGGSLCSTAAIANLPAGSYFFRVNASGAAALLGQTFPYSLTFSTYVCGDAVVSLGEECDDGGTANGDGCSASCTFEVNETEQNGTLLTADVYTSPWVARIDPDGDVDIVSVNVPGPASKITAKTKGPDGSLCWSGADTYLEILATNGDVLVANEDQGSYCSQAIATGLAAGKYYVRVKATPLLDMTNEYIFPYALDITVQ